MIVATAGHIDHGKTTLVKALTGVDTDRLPEEKARGISIDLGFAYWHPARAPTIGFVDVPGHERFVRNMLAGVCAVDCAMLVVAADDGVMPQTREHLQILDLLAVRRGIAVVTKVDRVSRERLAQVTAAVRDLLGPTSLAGAPVMTVSATTGEGLEALRELLAQAAKSVQRESQAGRRFRYAVDRAFTIAGSGTVVTGTVLAGTLVVGETVRLSPSGQEARVRAIQMDGRTVTGAVAGERCAINLVGPELHEVQRGNSLLHPALHAPTQRLDVSLRLLDSEARPLRHWTPVHLHLGTRDVTARVAMRRGTAVEPGSSGLAQLIVEQPVATLGGDRFILRDQSGQRTIGGGAVLDPWPPRGRPPAAQRLAQLQALAQSDPRERLLALSSCTPGGVDLAAFSRAGNLDEGAVAALLRHCALVPVGRAEAAVALPERTIRQIGAAVEAALARFHAASPQAAGIEPATLRAACAPALAPPIFQSLLRMLADEKRLELAGALVRQPRHVASDNPADQRMWLRVQPALEAAGLNGATVARLAADTGHKELLLRAFLQRKAQDGELVRVTPERFYLRSTMAVFAAVAAEVAQGAADGRFSAGIFRDRAGIGRALAVQVLESLDRLAITRRIGDVRVLRQDFVAILGAATAPPAPGRTASPAAAPSPRAPTSHSTHRREPHAR